VIVHGPWTSAELASRGHIIFSMHDLRSTRSDKSAAIRPVLAHDDHFDFALQDITTLLSPEDSSSLPFSGAHSSRRSFTLTFPIQVDNLTSVWNTLETPERTISETAFTFTPRATCDQAEKPHRFPMQQQQQQHLSNLSLSLSLPPLSC